MRLAPADSLLRRRYPPPLWAISARCAESRWRMWCGACTSEARVRKEGQSSVTPGDSPAVAARSGPGGLGAATRDGPRALLDSRDMHGGCSQKPRLTPRAPLDSWKTLGGRIDVKPSNSGTLEHTWFSSAGATLLPCALLLVPAAPATPRGGRSYASARSEHETPRGRAGRPRLSGTVIRESWPIRATSTRHATPRASRWAPPAQASRSVLGARRNR